MFLTFVPLSEAASLLLKQERCPECGLFPSLLEGGNYPQDRLRLTSLTGGDY